MVSKKKTRKTEKLTKDDRAYIKEMDAFTAEHKARLACNVGCAKHTLDILKSLEKQILIVRERIRLTTKEYQAWRVRHGLKKRKIL